jgi:hypothetical protein
MSTAVIWCKYMKQMNFLLDNLLGCCRMRMAIPSSDPRGLLMERRRHPRVAAPISALHFSPIFPMPKMNSTVDVSVGGTGIETPHALIPGERIEICIGIQPGAIKCQGEVVHVLWSKGETPAAGIRLQNLSKQDRSRVGKYISPIAETQSPSHRIRSSTQP